MTTTGRFMWLAPVFLMAVAVSADSVLSWKSGETTVTLSQNGTLTVSGNGEMGNYQDPIILVEDWNRVEDVYREYRAECWPPWRFAVKYGSAAPITGVVVEKGVTRIGNWALAGLPGINSVTLPAGVKAIGRSAFEYCAGLKSVTISNSVAEIEYEAFAGCGSLISVTVAADNATYSSEDGVLFDKNKTAVVLYPRGRRQNAYTVPNTVAVIGYRTFAGCGSLKSVTLPSGLKDIEYAAFAHSGLTSIAIPGGVSISGNAFYCCDSLKSIALPNSAAFIAGSAFEGCGSLTSVTIPDSVAFIGSRAFSGCGSLKSVTFPSGLTSISEEAFMGCRSLTSVTLPDNLTEIGKDAFRGCDGLMSINAGPKNPAYCSVDGVLFDKAQKTLLRYPCGKQGAYAIPNGVTKIEKMAFEFCGRLKSIALPNSVTYIGEYAFARCDSLTSVTLPNSVSEIRWGMFRGCVGLKSVKLPDGLRFVGLEMFSRAGLTSVTFLDSVTSIKHDAFYGCDSLRSVTLPSGLRFVGGRAFAYCAALKSITVLNPMPPEVVGGAFREVDGGACVYVPKGSIDAYRAAGTWKEFKCIREIAGPTK